MAVSMFVEFEKTINRFKKLTESSDIQNPNKSLPAMIILEREETGENKHAMVGSSKDLINLFEWGISQLTEGYKIEFDEMLELIKENHKNKEHILITDIKREI